MAARGAPVSPACFPIRREGGSFLVQDVRANFAGVADGVGANGDEFVLRLDLLQLLRDLVAEDLAADAAAVLFFVFRLV